MRKRQSKLWEILKGIKRINRRIEGRGPDGEIRITDAVEELAQHDEVYALKIEGEYHDTGNPMAYLKTLVTFALNDEEYGADIRQFLKHKLDE